MSSKKGIQYNPNVCIVGAGFAGICAGIQLKKKLNIQSFVIIEKNHDVGGVWLTNIFPGAACDLPAAYYSYSFAPSTKWSKLYCGREEIWNYIQNVTQKFEIYSHIRFNTSVKSMHWHGSTNKWVVTTVNNKGIRLIEEYDITIVATGPFRVPNKPAIFDTFTGPVMHSSEWNSTIRLENKVVGVIGVGPSAVQIVPAIASKTKELVFYQRTPSYIFPKALQCRIPGFVKLFFGIPGILTFSRYITFLMLELIAGSLQIKDSAVSKLVPKLYHAYLCSTIKDAQLRKQFTPSKATGVVSTVLSNKFHKTFNKPNVKLVSEIISTVEGTTITTEDGNTKKLDVLILCTGFKVQDFFAPIEIIGANGVNLLEEWRKSWPKTYYGLTCHATPNMLFLHGPNTVVFNSAVYLIELQCKFMIEMISLMKDKGFTYMQVTKSAETECWEEIKTRNQQTTFHDAGNTNKFVENTFLWPNTVKIYKKRIQDINVKKFNFA